MLSADAKSLGKFRGFPLFAEQRETAVQDEQKICRRAAQSVSWSSRTAPTPLELAHEKKRQAFPPIPEVSRTFDSRQLDATGCIALDDRSHCLFGKFCLFLPLCAIVSFCWRSSRLGTCLVCLQR
jgi:hypothetical protein